MVPPQGQRLAVHVGREHEQASRQDPLQQVRSPGYDGRAWSGACAGPMRHGLFRSYVHHTVL